MSGIWSLAQSTPSINGGSLSCALRFPHHLPGACALPAPSMCSKYVSPARQQALEGHGKGFPSTSQSTLAQSWAKEDAK